jgi:tRNA(Ile)-lysidine synthase
VPVDSLHRAVRAVPSGKWGVGVSGGADSVALLRLLLSRPDLHCHAIHLDHETRDGASGGDARFVADLCAELQVEVTLARRGELEATLHNLPTNRSARFRALRLGLFRATCATRDLQGVILAHHADDQAETIFQRLLRGSGPAGLTGMRPSTTVGRLTILRPLLAVPSFELRTLLTQQDQRWREDASNDSPAYQRNRVRAALRRHPALSAPLLELAGSMQSLTDWARAAAPTLGGTFATRELADLPDVLAHESARRWLVAQGAPYEDLSATVVRRLIDMARDAATPARRSFPGKLLVGRRRKEITARRAETARKRAG